VWFCDCFIAQTNGDRYRKNTSIFPCISRLIAAAAAAAETMEAEEARRIRNGDEDDNNDR